MKRHWTWDRLGVWVSGLCLIHCAVLPLLLVCLPVLGLANPHHSEWVHWALTGLAVPVGFLSLLPGYRRHRRPRVLGLGLLGALLLVVGPLAAESFVALHDVAHFGGSLGAVALIAAHLQNARQCACQHHAPATAV